MAHPLEGLALKLNRAEEHLNSLRSEIERFVQSDFYETVAEFDYRRRLVARLKNVKQPPPELSILIGDCVYNLRSSLDQMAFGMALAYTSPLPDKIAKTSSFPIFKTGPHFRTKGIGGGAHRMRGLPRGARAAIQRLQPYHRKNPSLRYLWMLEDLSNIDKHRLLHVTAAIPFGASFRLQGRGLIRLDRTEVLPVPIKENAVIGRFYGEFGPPPAVKVETNLVPEILFDKRSDAASVRNLPILEVLYGIRETIALCVLPELKDELSRLFAGTLTIQVGDLKPDHRRTDQRGYA